MLEINDLAEVVADAIKDATAPLIQRIAELEAKAAAIPERGEKGEPGEPGQSVDMAEVQNSIEQAVESAIKALPAPKDGSDGKDGVGLVNALRDETGALVLVMSDGSTKNLGQINGKDGETFTLDDFDVVPIDERTITMGFTKGELKHTFELEFPVTIYRGVYNEKETYARGDVVTWGGSAWHCDEAKEIKPGAPDSGWRLMVKAGRPGKDGK